MVKKDLVKVIVLLFCFLSSYVFSQSKKEKIEILSFQLDSLQNLHRIDQKSGESKQQELNERIFELSKTLNSSGVEIESRNNMIESQGRYIKELENKINLYRDSLSGLKKTKNIEFLGNYEMNLDNQSLMGKLNLTIEFFKNVIDSDNWKYLKDLYELEFTEQAKIVFRMDNRKFGIVIYAVRNPESDKWYRIPGTNIIAVFENIEGDWKFLQKYNTQSEPYSIRGTGAGFLGVQVIGESKIGFVFWGGTHLNGGYIEETYAIFQFDGIGIDKIFEGKRYESDYSSRTEEEIILNPELYNEDFYELTFQETNQEYYNLIETKKSHGKVVSTRVLSFNNSSLRYE